jgi:acetyl esterase/lipase
MDVDIRELAPPPADVRIAYGPDPFQFGDLRLPNGRGPHPVAVVIHGGFWRAIHDLKHTGHLCAALTREGIATWNLEYRRVGNPGGAWPGTLDDVMSGSQHLRLVASSCGLDLKRVIVIGHSAGGHLALWLGSRQKQRESLRLIAIVALAPVADLRRAWDLGLGGTIVSEFLGGTPEQVPERYAATSPIEQLPFGVPQTLIHGTVDDKVPYEISEHYVAVAQSRGDKARLVTLEGTGHFEIIDPRTEQFGTVRDVVLACYNS